MLKRFALVFSLAVCMALSMVTPTFAGDLRGTITWQYNNFVGTRGDTGATIWLWPVNYDKSSISKADEDSWIRGHSAPKNCFLTKVDGYGKYEIYGIPAGEYIIFILSKNTTRNIMLPVDNDAQYFSKYFNDIETFTLLNLKFHNFKYNTIKIVDSHPNVYSYDFGNTYI